MEKILVVAVHPDDETLGCGGTLLKLKEEGHEIHWLIVTGMAPEKYSAERIQKRKKEIDDVAADYGFKSVHELNFPAAGLDEVSDSSLVTAISKVFLSVQPTVVFLPYQFDVHSDHKKVFNTAYSCTKTFRYPFLKKVYMMEAVSETDFAPAVAGQGYVPNVFVNIDKFINKKLQILSRFEGEILPAPFPRSVETVKALAIVRGSVAGCFYAESFVLLKEIL